MSEDVEVLTVADVAARYGLTRDAARRWIARLVRSGAITATGRDLETGAKTYPTVDVERAWRERPGQGARTDRPRPEDPTPCPDPETPHP